MKSSLKHFTISLELYEKLCNEYTFDTSLTSVWDFTFDLESYQAYKVEYNRNIYLCLTYSYIGNVIEDKYKDLEPWWKRIVCMVKPNQVEPIIQIYSPSYCVSLVKKQLHFKGLTDEMIDKRLNEYTLEDGLTQIHISYGIEPYKVVRFDDCIYYDINKAHMDALIEIFPELKDWFLEIAKKSKKDIRYKSIANLYVGCLGKKTGKYRKTYNWIVNRTTSKVNKMLEQLMDCNSKIIYANTDGFVVQHPVCTLETSELIGDIKQETPETTFYMYYHQGIKDETTSHKVLQYGDKKLCINNIMISDLKYIDLRCGKVISYKEISDDNKLKKHINIKQHIVGEVAYE